MQTIKVDVDNSLFEKVLNFLNNLPKKHIKIEIEKRETTSNKKVSKKKLSAISIDTRNFTFDREEAHER